ncbi:MAG: VTT domain-containing protein [Candidatus Aminicenantes bacterium]|nr:VTT domain-containing protein [Candidatus Aminicenantes bacterium]
MGLQLNRKKTLNSKLKILFFILQVCFVLVLLVLWISCESFQKSKNLWILFFYSFPSEFLIAILPHEPILLYFGKFYTPLTIAFVAVAGTVLTEVLNYSVFKFVTDLKIFNKIQHKKAVNKIINYFYKAPFLALWIAGFTPVPFYPFRFLVVMAKYPLPKYILAVFLSRTPRFFILAWFGNTVKIPDSLLIGLFVVLIISINVPLIRNLLNRRKQKQNKLS